MTEPHDQNLAREVRADGREVRADGREGRADVREGGASRRDDRADEREDRAVGREKRAIGRETSAVGREDMTHRLVKTLIWLTIVLSILTAVSVARSFVVQNSVEHVEDNQAQSAKVGSQTNQVALDTLDELRQAVNRTGPSQETVDALASIKRMELHLCGGPCPPPE